MGCFDHRKIFDAKVVGKTFYRSPLASLGGDALINTCLHLGRSLIRDFRATCVDRLRVFRRILRKRRFCFDILVEDNDSLVESVDQIITDMHDDGTLAGFSEEWFGGLDLTTQE